MTIMKTKKLTSLTVALLAIFTVLGLNRASAVANIPSLAEPYIGLVWAGNTPAVTATNTLVLYYQNAFAIIEEGGPGFANTNYKNDPAGVRFLKIWQCAQSITTPFPFKMWDGTNNPSGAFADQNGSRVALFGIWYNPVPFVVTTTNSSFSIISTEPAHSINYVGSLATNTSSPFNPNTFSQTMRGYLIDSNGVVTTSYHNGESLADHPVNLVIFVLRVNYFANNGTQVTSTLNYLKGHLAQPAKFGLQATFSTGALTASSFLPTAPYVYGPMWSGTNWGPLVDGQHQMGLTFNVESIYGFQTNKTDWVYLNKGTSDVVIPDPAGYDWVNLNNVIAYRAQQTAPTPAEFPKSSEVFTPSFSGSNGPE